MDLRSKPQVFRIDPNMCTISPKMNKFVDNQPMKNRQDLKPFDISNTTQETDEESTSELGVYIVVGVFRGMVHGMDNVITCILS